METTGTLSIRIPEEEAGGRGKGTGAETDRTEESQCGDTMKISNWRQRAAGCVLIRCLYFLSDIILPLTIVIKKKNCVHMWACSCNMPLFTDFLFPDLKYQQKKTDPLADDEDGFDRDMRTLFVAQVLLYDFLFVVLCIPSTMFISVSHNRLRYPSQLSIFLSQSFWFHVCFTFVCRHPSIHLKILHVNR